MSEQELRELDIKVHRALYPEQRVVIQDGPHGPYYRAVTPGDGPNTWVTDIPLPWYSTDIQDWEPVYAARPKWWWDQYEASIIDGERYVEVQLRAYDTPLSDATVRVYWHESTGLRAYALGRARCVVAWAEAQR